MLHTIIILLAFFALTFAVKESVLFDRPRSFLIRLHPFFYQLFSCYFCCGFHSGWIIYLLNKTHYGEFLLWGLAAAATSYIINIVLDRLAT